MDNLATLTAKPQRINFGGEEHDVHPLSFEDFGTLQEWVDRQFGDPFEAVNRAIAKGRVVPGPDGEGETTVPYTAAQQQFLYKIALEQATQGKHPIGTPEADAKLLSLAGLQEQLFLSIRKGNPAFTREDAARIYGRLSPGDFARIFRATNVDMVVSDPKAMGPDGTTTTTATTPAPAPGLNGGSSGIRPSPSCRGRRRNR
jgi:hypothetical protein